MRCLLTKSSEHAPDTPAYVEIVVRTRCPGGGERRADGHDRVDREPVRSSPAITASGGSSPPARAREAPAAVVLHAAHAALESAVLPADVLRAKRERAPTYAAVIAEGLWFSPDREAMDVAECRGAGRGHRLGADHVVQGHAAHLRGRRARSFARSRGHDALVRPVRRRARPRGVRLRHLVRLRSRALRRRRDRQHRVGGGARRRRRASTRRTRRQSWRR